MQTSGKVLGKVHQLEKHHLLCQPTIRRLKKEYVVVVEMYVVWLVVLWWFVVGGWWCFLNVALFGTCYFKIFNISRDSSFFTVFSVVFCVLMHVSQGLVDGWQGS